METPIALTGGKSSRFFIGTLEGRQEYGFIPGPNDLLLKIVEF